MRRSRGDTILFWGLIALIVIGDVFTKRIAVESLGGATAPREVIGETVRFWLVFNKGAAFGLNVGDHSRWVFLLLTVGALVILGRLYRVTRGGDNLRIISLALVCGGAVGNLLDRIRWDRGVVDFIDVGIGSMRWPTFNIADMAVSTGAFLLAWVLWGEDRAAAAAAVPAPANAPPVVGESRETG